MKLSDLANKGPKPVWIRYLLLVGFFFLVTRTILDSSFRHSALLYVLVPYLVSVLVYFFIPQAEANSKPTRFFIPGWFD